MVVEIGRQTGFSDVQNAGLGAGDDRYVRGASDDGKRTLFVNKRWSLDNLKDVLKRALGIGPSLEQQKKDGARAVRESLVNQFGVAVADAVLTNVAASSNRTKSDLMRDGVTTKELRQITSELAKSDSPVKQQAARMRATTESVNLTLMRWNDKMGPMDDGSLGAAYRSLDPKQQNFVSKRLLSLARQDAKDGVTVDAARIEKLAKRVMTQARSDKFEELSDNWKTIDDRCANLVGASRAGDASQLVTNALEWGDAFGKVAQLESVAAGKIGADKSDEQNILSAVGADDVIEIGNQALDEQMPKMSPAEARAAYGKMMGAHGDGRAVLFAASLAAMTMPAEYGRDGDNVVSKVQRGVQSSAVALGGHGGVDGAGRETGTITESIDDALNDMGAVSDKQREEIEAKVWSATKEKYGLDDTEKFDKEYDVALKIELKKARNRNKAPLVNALDQKNPFSGDPKVDKLIDLAMEKAGIADKALVKQAYDAIMREAKNAAGINAQDRNPSISVVSTND